MLAGHRPGGLVDLVRRPGCFRLGVGRYHRLVVARQLGCCRQHFGVSGLSCTLAPASFLSTDND